MTDLILSFIRDVLSNFDFAFCIIVNVATYIIIKSYCDLKKCKALGTWGKRVIFLLVSMVIATIYLLLESNEKILLNSVILAPVTWSWIFKPICKKLGIDYNQEVCFSDKD